MTDSREAEATTREFQIAIEMIDALKRELERLHHVRATSDSRIEDLEAGLREIQTMASKPASTETFAVTLGAICLKATSALATALAPAGTTIVNMNNSADLEASLSGSATKECSEQGPK